VARPPAPARPAIAWLRYVTLAGALAPTPAIAGAWIAPEGGQEIWTSVAGQREELRFYETSTYWEIPLGADTSIVASPWVEQNYDGGESWRAEAVVGVKRAVFRDERFAFALSASVVWESEPDDGCGEGGFELRGLAGGSADEGRAFMNFEVAGRTLEDGCAGARAEVTAGRHLGDRWLTLGQLFVDASEDDEAVVRGQLSLARFSEEGRGVQLGVRARLDGEEDELALVLGFWGRPGDRR
jgi:hypothetical protein